MEMVVINNAGWKAYFIKNSDEECKCTTWTLLYEESTRPSKKKLQELRNKYVLAGRREEALCTWMTYN